MQNKTATSRRNRWRQNAALATDSGDALGGNNGYEAWSLTLEFAGLRGFLRRSGGMIGWPALCRQHRLFERSEDMKDEGMCYVAADPEQPGAAWAVTVDEPEYVKDNAKEIAGWIRKGANVMRVPTQTARDMLGKWESPEKKRHGGQAALL